MDNTLDKTGHGMEHKRADKAVEFRFAKPQDIPLILRFIRELADYEGMLDQVVALGMKDGETVGFALFFHNFSTFLGRAGIYLEDLYVRPEYRGQGFGTAFLNRLAAIAVERGCGRLEWWCLDWNKPSIDFYLGIGARPMSDWTVYRIDGERLEAMAADARR